MPPAHVRITLETMTPIPITLEYGEPYVRDLTEEEKKELQDLEDLLVSYQDFTTAEDIGNEERQALMGKKKRYEELKAVQLGEPEIRWVPQDTKRLQTLLIMMRAGFVPIYSENTPHELLELMLDPTINISVGGSSPLPIGQEPIELTVEERKKATGVPEDPVIQVENALIDMEGAPKMGFNQGKTWLEIVEISTTNPAPGQQTLTNTVYIMPWRYLKDDWQPINDALKVVFGDNLDWTRAGKESYWSVKF